MTTTWGGDRSKVLTRTIKDAAKHFNVSTRNISRAGEIQKQGIPKLIHAVKQGKTSINAAYNLAKLGKEEAEKLLEIMDPTAIFKAMKGLRPENHTLYRHFDAKGKLLYVGVSLNALQRLEHHRSTSHWFRDIRKITIEYHEGRYASLVAEHNAIKNENPLYNKHRRIEHMKEEKR